MYSFEVSNERNVRFDLKIEGAGKKQSFHIRHFHISQIGSDPEFTLYRTGNDNDMRITLKQFVLDRKRYGYIPINNKAKDIAEFYGWTEWKA